MASLAGPKLTALQARRIALRALGFGLPRPADPGRADLSRLTQRLGQIQIDSVSVLARAHYVPAFSRLGTYDPAWLDALAYGGRRRQIFEYWGHVASLIRVELQPLLRWRMARAAAGQGIYGGLARFGRERRDFIAAALDAIRKGGPMTAGDLEEGRGASGWWEWSDAKRALEWLFWAGEVTTAGRRGFARLYDLPERVLPRAVLATPTPDDGEAIRGLLAVSAKALGVATASDLRDYFRLDVADANRHLPELVEAGVIEPVQVKGWVRQAYRAATAPGPRLCGARALVSPFDPLLWERERAQRLFGFHYRIEIYTPAHKRQHGYYVLPFLMGEAIAARVDLKADRASRRLLVQASHVEPGHDPAQVAAELAAELAALAQWLGLADVVVAERGDLAPALRHAVG